MGEVAYLESGRVACIPGADIRVASSFAFEEISENSDAADIPLIYVAIWGFRGTVDVDHKLKPIKSFKHRG